eukprot:1188456-Amphidinium_carterae.2
MPSMPTGHGRVRRLQKRLAKLRRANPSHIGGRQCFFRYTLFKHDDKIALQSDGRFTKQFLMSRHAHHYAQLPQHVKDEWEKRASVLRVERRHALDEAIKDATVALDVALNSLHSYEDLACAGGVKLYAWTPAEVEAATHFNETLALTRTQVQAMRERSMKCSAPVQESMFDDLVNDTLLPQLPLLDVSQLLRDCALRRAHMRDAICGVLHSDSWHYYRMIYASLNPVYVVWVPLQLVTLPVTTLRVATWENVMHTYQGISAFAWLYDPEDAMFEDIFQTWEGGEFFVWPSSGFTGPCMLTSDEDPVPIAEFLKFSPLDQSKHEAKNPAETTQRAPRAVQASDARYLASLLELGTTASQRSRASIDQVQDPADDIDVVPQDGTDDAVALEQQYKKLEADRQAMHCEDDDLEEHFRTDVEGGAWSLARSSRLISGVRCFVKKTSPVHVFCNRFRIAVSASFSREKYGHEDSVLLADIWRSRLYWMWRSHASCGEPETFPAKEHEENVTETVLRKLRALEGQSASRRDAIMQILLPAPWAERVQPGKPKKDRLLATVLPKASSCFLLKESTSAYEDLHIYEVSVPNHGLSELQHVSLTGILFF